MLRPIQYMISLIVLVLMSTGITFSQEPKILLKDSLEKGSKVPDGWKSGARLPGVRYVYDKRRGKTGKRSLSLQKKAQRYFPIAQWYRILPYSGQNSELKVSCQVRAEKATKAIIDVQFLGENEKQIGHKWVNYIGAQKAGDPPVSHDWKEYSGVVSIPAKTKQIALALQIYGPGKVWFDDLEATFVESTTSATDTNKNAIKVKVGKGVGHYLVIPAKAKQTSNKGQALLIVLPGGDGSADFHPFVKRIHENTLGDDFLLVQPIAKEWTPSQKVVWPTATSKTGDMQYTTEALVDAIIDDVSQKHKLDFRRIYLLGWSSAGPAAYSILLQKETQVSGAIIAMSVFQPNRLPEITNAKQRSIYLLHSPQDNICPYRMAKTALDTFSKANVQAKLVDYPGGHGWKGNVYGNIRQGIEWLQKNRSARD